MIIDFSGTSEESRTEIRGGGGGGGADKEQALRFMQSLRIFMISTQTHTHTHTHLTAGGAHDAGFRHHKLKALLQRLHRFVLVAQHIQQPCAEEQRILLEFVGIILLLVVQFYDLLEGVKSLKYLVLDVQSGSGCRYAHARAHTWSECCLSLPASFALTLRERE